MLLSHALRERFHQLIGVLLFLGGIALLASLVTHQPLDPSWDVAGRGDAVANQIGYPGAVVSNLLLQGVGLAAFLFPLGMLYFALRQFRAAVGPGPIERLCGMALLLLVICAGLSLGGLPELFAGTVHAGGAVGALLSGALLMYLNETGTGLTLLALAVSGVYLATAFRLEDTWVWLRDSLFATSRPLSGLRRRWAAWRAGQKEQAARVKARRAARKVVRPHAADAEEVEEEEVVEPAAAEEFEDELPEITPYEGAEEIADGESVAVAMETAGGDPEFVQGPEADLGYQVEHAAVAHEEKETPKRAIPYRIPSTELLEPTMERGGYDREELHRRSKQITAKLQEFGLGGKVSQINPGPIVTTFEFKPDPGIKYNRIVNLSEDLCMALECESIRVQRIPGKSTVGIEVPNRKREVIRLREIIESDEFLTTQSRIPLALGKDINGHIKLANLESMPHLLIAGSTGSGKSVCINSVIMSILLKASPSEVRFIMVDPKTVELSPYVDIPHLLTPVITDMKKASNALKNACREMERRLKLLAEFGVRNIDQFNKKLEKLQQKSLPWEDAAPTDDLEPLPYIVIIIDELADMMMLAKRDVEESITRLAQMARAVGIHLMLATQRPSVDVITGLIKANIPARISFRLATKIDSRTILDDMGAEALLGKGDMLFLPPGSGRMVRLHGPFVTEEEIEAVVKEWRRQGEPDYENDYLVTPDGEDDSEASEDSPGFDDPVYQDAVRVVVEMGKASTSTLQRRLRIGYGRAASILDAMEKDGIIGPPDGPRPREVLKAPNWLAEVEMTSR